MFVDRPKVLHSLMVILGVAAAGAWLYGRLAAMIAAGLLAAGGISSYVVKSLGHRALPDAPRRGQRLLEWLAIRYVALGTFLIAVPIVGAVLVGSELKLGTRRGGQLVGFVLAFALIEAAKAVDPDGDMIDRPVASLFKVVFQQAYRDQFDDRGGPLPIWQPSPSQPGKNIPTDVWTSVTSDQRHNGWGAGSRRDRAEDIQRYIDANRPIPWKVT